MKNPGFRIKKNIERPSKELISKFNGRAVANIGDALGRFQIMDDSIKTLNKKDIHMVGPAYTVRVRPGDNLMLHKAIDLANEGDIIVVDAQKSKNGLWGEILSTLCMAKGIGGLVIEGGVRDAHDIYELGFPVFAYSNIAAGGDKDGPGEINFPISCGGVSVKPGDIIVGDYDGVVVVQKEEAEFAAEKVAEIEEKEKKILEKINNGEEWNREWLKDEALKEKGCEIIE